MSGLRVTLGVAARGASTTRDTSQLHFRAAFRRRFSKEKYTDRRTCCIPSLRPKNSVFPVFLYGNFRASVLDLAVSLVDKLFAGGCIAKVII